MRRNATVRTIASEPRISVVGDPSVIKQMKHEKAETGLSFIEIVNARLAKSYEEHPIFHYGQAAASA